MLKRRWYWCVPLVAVSALILYVSAPAWLSSRYIERFDFIALGLVILAAVPWLTQWLDEFEFGGLKVRLRNVEENVAANRQIVEEIAISTSVSGSQREELEERKNKGEIQASKGSMERFRNLAAEYVSIRKAMHSGPERTARMTEIFGQLEREARALGPDRMEVNEWLLQEDAGLQIAALGWLRAHPEYVKPGTLISVVDNSNQAFVQYWALRVLRRHVEQDSVVDFTPRDVRQLKRLEKQIHPGTDRHYQIRCINEILISSV